MTATPKICAYWHVGNRYCSKLLFWASVTLHEFWHLDKWKIEEHLQIMGLTPISSIKSKVLKLYGYTRHKMWPWRSWSGHQTKHEWMDKPWLKILEYGTTKLTGCCNKYLKLVHNLSQVEKVINGDGCQFNIQNSVWYTPLWDLYILYMAKYC